MTQIIVNFNLLKFYVAKQLLVDKSRSLLADDIMSRSILTLTIPPPGIPGVNKIFAHKCPGAGKKLTVKCPGAGKKLTVKCPGVGNFAFNLSIEIKKLYSAMLLIVLYSVFWRNTKDF